MSYTLTCGIHKHGQYCILLQAILMSSLQLSWGTCICEGMQGEGHAARQQGCEQLGREDKTVRRSQYQYLSCETSTIEANCLQASLVTSMLSSVYRQQVAQVEGVPFLSIICANCKDSAWRVHHCDQCMVATSWQPATCRHKNRNTILQVTVVLRPMYPALLLSCMHAQ